MVVIGLDSTAFQLGTVGVGAGLAVIMGDNYGTDQESVFLEFVVKPENVHIVGDAQVIAHFVPLYVQGADDYNDLRRVGELLEHTHL